MINSYHSILSITSRVYSSISLQKRGKCPQMGVASLSFVQVRRRACVVPSLNEVSKLRARRGQGIEFRRKEAILHFDMLRAPSIGRVAVVSIVGVADFILAAAQIAIIIVVSFGARLPVVFEQCRHHPILPLILVVVVPPDRQGFMFLHYDKESPSPRSFGKASTEARTPRSIPAVFIFPPTGDVERELEEIYSPNKGTSARLVDLVPETFVN